MGIGRLKCPVVDVNDLAVAEAFYSELTGIPVIPSVFPGRYAYLGQPDPWRADLIMHLVATLKGPEANRGHIDIWVRDIDEAIPRIEAIGGSVKKPPTIYPWPGSFPGESPRLRLGGDARSVRQRVLSGHDSLGRSSVRRSWMLPPRGRRRPAVARCHQRNAPR